MLKIKGHQVNLRVTAPEKEINSVNITDYKYVQITQPNISPWISISLLRFRGKVPSGRDMFSGVLRISSSLIWSSFPCCDGKKIKFNLCIYMKKDISLILRPVVEISVASFLLQECWDLGSRFCSSDVPSLSAGGWSAAWCGTPKKSC